MVALAARTQRRRARRARPRSAGRLALGLAARRGARPERLGRLGVGEAARARVVVTGPARATPFSRAATGRGARLRRRPRPRASARCELHSGRAPPRGAVLEIVRARLVRAARARDRLRRARLARAARRPRRAARPTRHGSSAGGVGSVASPTGCARTSSERWNAEARVSGWRSCAGFVLGDDDGLPDELRQSFRASGLAAPDRRLGSERRDRRRGDRWARLAARHRASGSVTSSRSSAIALVRARRRLGAVGRPRGRGGLCRVGGLARVAAGRSLARAGARAPWSCSSGSRRHCSSRGSSCRSPPSQRSSSSFPRAQAHADGYPVPEWLVLGAAVSAACSVATAPISWLHFGAVAVWTVPGEPRRRAGDGAVVLTLSLAAAVGRAGRPSRSRSLSPGWRDGRPGGSRPARGSCRLPHAQVRSPSALLGVGLADRPVVIVAVAALPARAAARRDSRVGGSGLRASPPAGGRLHATALRGRRPGSACHVPRRRAGRRRLLETPRRPCSSTRGRRRPGVAKQLRRHRRALAVRDRPHAPAARPHRRCRRCPPTVLHVGVVLDPGASVGLETTSRRRSRSQRAGMSPWSSCDAATVFRVGRLDTRACCGRTSPGPPGEDPNQRADSHPRVVRRDRRPAHGRRRVGRHGTLPLRHGRGAEGRAPRLG